MGEDQKNKTGVLDNEEWEVLGYCQSHAAYLILICH
jgi:hypothetical protein